MQPRCPPPHRPASPASALLAAIALAGCAGGGARLTLVEENDVFNVLNESDRDYTQGGTFGLTIPESGLPDAVANAIRSVPGMRGATSVHGGILVGQQIYTPEAIWVRRLIPDDRPYAGWLYGGVSVEGIHLDPDPDARDDRVDRIALDFGVVGPKSGADEAQDSVHVIIRSPRPEGWHHQIDAEPAGLLLWERRRRFVYGVLDEGWDWDFLGRATVRAGNAYADAGGGFLARFGWHVPRDFGPRPVDGSGLDRDPADPPPAKWHAYLHMGASARGVAYSIFLDGNSDGGGHSVERRDVVGDVSFGFAAGWGPVAVTYTQHVRSPEFRERRRYHRYASVAITWTFGF